MQNWKDLYKELSTTIQNNLTEIKWVDLWHNQVSFLESEHPFPTPAIFLGFRIQDAQDTGNKTQTVNLQLDCYVYYETFADTYSGSWNQDSALAFIGILNDLYALLHGSFGTNYSSMRRISMSPVDTGGAGNLYLVSFSCVLRDYAAQDDLIDIEVDDVIVEPGIAPERIETDPIYVIP